MTAALADADFDIVLRREDIGIPTEVSPASLTAATMAATLPALDVTLFLRETLCGGMREPDETECE